MPWWRCGAAVPERALHCSREAVRNGRYCSDGTAQTRAGTKVEAGGSAVSLQARHNVVHTPAPCLRWHSAPGRIPLTAATIWTPPPRALGPLTRCSGCSTVSPSLSSPLQPCRFSLVLDLLWRRPSPPPFFRLLASSSSSAVLCLLRRPRSSSSSLLGGVLAHRRRPLSRARLVRSALTFAFCRCSAAVPLLFCRCSAAVLPLFCRCSAAVLPLFCRCSAAVLPLFCRCFTAILPLFCRCSAAVLPFSPVGKGRLCVWTVSMDGDASTYH